MDFYNNRVLHSKSREHKTSLDLDIKKARRRVYDAVNKCKDLEVLSNVAELLQRGSANGSARDS